MGSYNGKANHGKRTLGNKKYELSNHLGNVLSVISDNKIGIGSNGVADYYEPLVISESDYYPFGMSMKERSFSNEEYRFGFNGMEKDGDLGEGKTDFGARVYDEKAARWFAVDGITKHSLSSYQFGKLNPIIYVDIDGNDEFYFNAEGELILIVPKLGVHKAILVVSTILQIPIPLQDQEYDHIRYKGGLLKSSSELSDEN